MTIREAAKQFNQEYFKQKAINNYNENEQLNNKIKSLEEKIQELDKIIENLSKRLEDLEKYEPKFY